MNFAVLAFGWNCTNTSHDAFGFNCIRLFGKILKTFCRLVANGVIVTEKSIEAKLLFTIRTGRLTFSLMGTLPMSTFRSLGLSTSTCIVKEDKNYSETYYHISMTILLNCMKSTKACKGKVSSICSCKPSSIIQCAP